MSNTLELKRIVDLVAQSDIDNTVYTIIDSVSGAIKKYPLGSFICSVAPIFDATHAYAAGDYCNYNGQLYKFTAAHAAGSWSGSDVSAVSVTDVLKSTNERLTAMEHGSGLTDEIKLALLQLASKVAYIDGDGQNYYDALEDALYPPGVITSINAVYTQTGAVYDNDSLDTLKNDLVVTAYYSNQTSSIVTTYTLSGSLTAGESTITVSYGGETTTFNVTVTAILYPLTNGSHTFTGTGTNGRSVEVTNKKHIKYSNPNPTTASRSVGSYAIFDLITDNHSDADVNNINAPTTPLFTIPSGATAIMIISNIQYESISGTTQTTKYAMALRSGSTSIISSGDLAPNDTSKTVTLTIDANTNITCGFLFAGQAIKNLEFDISLTVNGVRWM